MFYVYILCNIENRLYIGQTNDLERRLQEHVKKRASKYTKDYDGFELAYVKDCQSRIEAMRREKQIKRWTRAKKEALISGNLDLLKKL